MNRVILTGRLTRDPESRMTQSNMEVARFSIAAQGDFVNKNGEREVEFINCVAFGGLGGTINKFCRKGSLIGVQGRIRNSNYTAQDGSKRYTTDVVVEQMEFLGSRQGGNDTSSSNYSNPSYANNSSAYSPMGNDAMPDIETTDISEDPYKNFGEEVTLSSDDLPF